jgi:phage-related protein
MKRLEWVGSALDDLREFPQEARNEAGHQLHRVQCAKEPSDWKPMNAIGSGVRELRIHTNREHRVFYVVRFDDAVYVLSAFEKKSQKTPKSELELGRTRYQLVIARHRSRKEKR